MADGKVSSTIAAFTGICWSKPHLDKNDVMLLSFCVWLYGGEGGKSLGLCMRRDGHGWVGCRCLWSTIHM